MIGEARFDIPHAVAPDEEIFAIGDITAAPTCWRPCSTTPARCSGRRRAGRSSSSAT